jgi:hypothetical protein
MTENGSMKLKRHETEMKGMAFVTPTTHIPLFKHCTGGINSVYEDTFHREIKPLLMAHGVKEFSVD